MILSRQIASLLKLVECGSFSKAAKELYISTSALVQQINLLEDEVGVLLLNRSWKGIQLTDAGAVFCDRMKKVAVEVDDAMRLAREAGVVPEIRIAYAQNIQQQYIYGIYRLYSERHPGKMRIFPLEFTKLVETVKQNDFDACYIQSGRYVRESGLVTYSLIREKPTLALPKDHPLAKKSLIRIEELAGMEVVLPDYGLHDSTDVFSDELRSAKIPVRIRHISNLMESEIYCREHHAARLCLNRVFDPEMVSVPLQTEAMFGICLACRDDPDVLKRLSSLISLTKECCKSGIRFLSSEAHDLPK